MSGSMIDIQLSYSGAVSHSTALRIKRDMHEIVNNPPPGIYGLPDENDVQLLNVLIIGPCDTPYRGGMFRFEVKLRDDYPIRPPLVKCLTTQEHNVRLGPELLGRGIVCLSLLEPKSWSPEITIAGLVQSIQSLLRTNPYGDWKASDAEECVNYSRLIQHETIRIAVCDVYEKKELYTDYYADKIEKTFDQNYDFYVQVCNDNKQFDGTILQDPHTLRQVHLNFRELLNKLQAFKTTQ